MKGCAVYLHALQQNRNRNKPELTFRVILTVVLILFVTDRTEGCIGCEVHNRTFLKISVLSLGHRSSWDPQSPQYMVWTSFFHTWTHYVQAHCMMWYLEKKNTTATKNDRKPKLKQKPSKMRKTKIKNSPKLSFRKSFKNRKLSLIIGYFCMCWLINSKQLVSI